jgi:hypothetical protein
MLDVGANFGYYSFYAAKMGCRVVAWEPIPIFRAFVEAGLALNNLTHRVHLRSNVVSDVGGKSIQMTVPQRGIWGTASVGGLNVDPAALHASAHHGALPSPPRWAASMWIRRSARRRIRLRLGVRRSTR